MLILRPYGVKGTSSMFAPAIVPLMIISVANSMPEHFIYPKAFPENSHSAIDIINGGPEPTADQKCKKGFQCSDETMA